MYIHVHIYVMILCLGVRSGVIFENTGYKNVPRLLHIPGVSLV